MAILIKLFWAFTKIGLFAIGGAYSFLPLIEREVVQGHHWLTKEEFLDALGMFRVFPGALSVKYATYTGYKVAGAPGLIAANLGNFLATAVLVIFALGLYHKYRDLPSVKGAFNLIQLAVFAMIMAVAFQLVNVSQLLQLRNMLIVFFSFVLFIYTKVHPAIIIVIAGLIGALWR